MNAEELERRTENGRQSRNGAVLVILMKKLRQPTVEKLLPSAVSNGCGNGIGRGGGDDGIVGTFCGAAVAVGCAEMAEVVDSGDVGKTMLAVVGDGVWGCGFRLCSVHL
jgi:hypothetical protein